MGNEKKMIVNAATCDVRGITEEVLQSYESICINAAAVISSSGAKALIDRSGNVTMNAAAVFVCEDETELSTINGKSEIGPENLPARKTVLVVNGTLTIRPCDPAALDNYVSVLINGRLLCPKSLSGFLARATVNGKAELYPDGAVILKKNTAIDRVFALRARDSLYWSPSLLFLDPTVDDGVLREKGACFEAEKVIIIESLVEKMIDLISEEADIVIVPDGTAFVNDDEKLTAGLVTRFGPKLYINGDLEVREGAGEALPKLEYVNVNGELKIDREWEEAFLALKPVYKELAVIDREKERKFDRVIADKISFKVDRSLLERNPGGILVSDCAAVKIAPEVPAELIEERLEIRDCASVSCTPEQESAVGLITEDCGEIRAGEPDKEDGGFLRTLKAVVNTRMVNAAEYRF